MDSRRLASLCGQQRCCQAEAGDLGTPSNLPPARLIRALLANRQPSRSADHAPPRPARTAANRTNQGSRRRIRSGRRESGSQRAQALSHADRREATDADCHPWLKRSRAHSENAVGMAGFEPAASCSQSRRANQAALHPAEPKLAYRSSDFRARRRDPAIDHAPVSRSRRGGLAAPPQSWEAEWNGSRYATRDDLAGAAACLRPAGVTRA